MSQLFKRSKFFHHGNRPLMDFQQIAQRMPKAKAKEHGQFAGAVKIFQGRAFPVRPPRAKHCQGFVVSMRDYVFQMAVVFNRLEDPAFRFHSAFFLSGMGSTIMSL